MNAPTPELKMKGWSGAIGKWSVWCDNGFLFRSPLVMFFCDGVRWSLWSLAHHIVPRVFASFTSHKRAKRWMSMFCVCLLSTKPLLFLMFVCVCRLFAVGIGILPDYSLPFPDMVAVAMILMNANVLNDIIEDGTSLISLLYCKNINELVVMVWWNGYRWWSTFTMIVSVWCARGSHVTAHPHRTVFGCCSSSSTPLRFILLFHIIIDHLPFHHFPFLSFLSLVWYVSSFGFIFDLSFRWPHRYQPLVPIDNGQFFHVGWLP